MVRPIEPLGRLGAGHDGPRQAAPCNLEWPSGVEKEVAVVTRRTSPSASGNGTLGSGAQGAQPDRSSRQQSRTAGGVWPVGALIGAVAIASCGVTPGARTHHVRPTPSVSQLPTPFTSPVGRPDAGALSCSLPVYGSALVVGSAGSRAEGGFVKLPSGAVSTAVGTGLIPVAGQFDQWQTSSTPALVGDSFEESYDSTLAKWVPASPAELSPTGTQYAYVVVADIANPATTAVYVHLVTISSGSDQVLYATGQTEVLGWAGGQILLVDHTPTSEVSQGLLSLDPATATARTLQPAVSGVEWYLAGTRAVWGGQVNAADPSPPQVQVPWDEALRYDLASGQVSVWSYHPGDQVTVVGTTASGDPLETVQNASQTRLLLATSPTTSTTLLTGPGLASLHGLSVYSTYTDSHGTWVATDQGLYLLTPGLGFIQEQAGNFANATIVGACG